MKHDITKDFLNYLRFEKGHSNCTIDVYNRYIKELNLFFYNVLYNKISLNDFYRLLQKFRDKNLGDTSICLIINIYKSFFKFLKRENLIKVNITKYIQYPNTTKKVPMYFSVEEIVNIIRQPLVNLGRYTDKMIAARLRDHAILELLYSSGVRASELCTLKVKDLDLDNKHVHVIGKGKISRLIPIGSFFINAFQRYYIKAKYDYLPEAPAFKSETGSHLDRISIWRLIKKYAKESGIKKNIFPHILRHAYATHLLEKGADIAIIQQLMGHKSIESTQVYLNQCISHIQEKFKKCHLRF